VAIRVQCMCGELIDAQERMAGREVHCPRCRRLVLVPGTTTRARPTTVFSLAVVAGIAITLGLLLLPGWLAGLRDGGPTCADNLRALGAAIHAYARANDGWMPSGWDNTFALIAPYLDERDREGPNAVWRCPADRFCGADPTNHCSYGINADETGGRDGVYPGPFAHRVRDGGSRQVGVRLDDLPPKTILMIEHWSPLNTLHLDEPAKPNRGEPGAGDRCALVIRDYGTWRKPTFDEGDCLVDAGSYLFLKPYEGSDTPLDRMYHGGRLHVLYKNGQVELVPIRRLIEPPPNGFAPVDPLEGFTNTPWTRIKDLRGLPP